MRIEEQPWVRDEHVPRLALFPTNAKKLHLLLTRKTTHAFKRGMKSTAIGFLALLPALAPANDAGDWLAPFEHVHASSNGTPVVHSFNIEPAITGRDLFVTSRYRSSDDASEREIELELEWALTHRLGVILELPYTIEDEKGGPRSDGFGNLAVVPRALLYEGERFMLTAQVEVGVPTASHDFEGETSVAPGFAAWADLGGWWTLNSQVGIEHGFDTDGTELVYGIGLIKSFGKAHQEHHHHQHASSGGLNLHFEMTGSTGLNGDEDGDTSMEGLIGLSYGLCSGLDIRGGYEFPLTSPGDFDHGWVAGFVWHF